jgi:hypothetical protein
MSGLAYVLLHTCALSPHTHTHTHTCSQHVIARRTCFTSFWVAEVAEFQSGGGGGFYLLYLLYFTRALSTSLLEYVVYTYLSVETCVGVCVRARKRESERERARERAREREAQVCVCVCV